MTKTIIKNIFRILIFVTLTTFNFEYFLNQASSTLFNVFCFLIEIALLYYFMYPIFKHLNDEETEKENIKKDENIEKQKKEEDGKI